MPICPEIPDIPAAPQPAEPPERYDVTMIVRVHGAPSVAIEMEMPGIKRSDIMSPDYGVPAVRSMVEYLEAAIGGRDANPS